VKTLDINLVGMFQTSCNFAPKRFYWNFMLITQVTTYA